MAQQSEFLLKHGTLLLTCINKYMQVKSGMQLLIDDLMSTAV